MISKTIYSGTSIKRTPLGIRLLAVIERWSSLRGLESQPQYAMSQFLLHESWSFANCFSSSYKLWKGKLSRLLQNNAISAIIFCWFWVWLSVLGGYFQLLKLIGDYRKLLVVRSREVAVPERLLYIEVIVVSIRTRVLGRFIACGCFLEVVVNGGSTVP